MKYKKILAALLASQFIILAGGCEFSVGNSINGGSSVDTQQGSGEQTVWEEEQDNNIFKDRHYQTGFKLTNTASVPGPTYLGDLHYGGITDIPSQWILAQWCTKYLIQPTDKPKEEGGWYVWENESKVVKVNTEEGAIYMECNASKEFDAPRVNMQDWPHLLIEQYTTSRCPDLSTIDSLKLQMEFVIDKCEKKMKPEEYDATLHTAQFQINFTVSNQNKNSPGYGDCIWFGLQFFDDRFPCSQDSVSIDGGKDSATGLAMYGVSSKRFLKEPVYVGDYIEIDFDILPEIKKALQACREYDGVEVFRNTNLEDLKLTTMNIGWELPGTYDVASTIYKLNLVYDKSKK